MATAHVGCMRFSAKLEATVNELPCRRWNCGDDRLRKRIIKLEDRVNAIVKKIKQMQKP